MTTLTVTDSHVVLTALLPPAGVLYPGAGFTATLSPALSSRKTGGAGAELGPVVEDARVSLVCVSKQSIAGGERVQSRVGNVLQGYGPLHTFSESLTLARTLGVLLPPSPSSSSSSSSPSSPAPQNTQTFQLLVPPPSSPHALVPSTPKRVIGISAEMQKSEASARVTWRLQVEGRRRGKGGWLGMGLGLGGGREKEVALSIDLPVVFPDVRHFMEESNTSISIVAPIKLEGEEGELSVEAKLSCILPHLSLHPLSFTFTLLPPLQPPTLPSPSLSSFLTSLSPPTMSLARLIRTSPVLSSSSAPGVGLELEWPPVRIAGGTLARKEKRREGGSGVSEEDKEDGFVEAEEGEGEWEGGGGGGTLKWYGSVVPPKGEHTVESEGLGISYFLSATLSHPAFASTGGNLNIKLPVFLPSSPVEVGDLPPQVALEGGGGGEGVGVREGELPGYVQ
ncbi:hypothetical protein JCM8547_003805 [Rhodosporidiobolus lusitaniae]